MVRRAFNPGDRCKVVADCGIRNDDDSSVASVEMRGQHVQVAGANCNYKHAETGEAMVGVTTANGALAAVPARALKHKRSGIIAGSSRAFRDGWDRIFGS